ncbi:hypothetical protein WA026_011481 [Henosepilachna vigintioctopunctata]|uniref:Target of rapamycin complex 2 subunit MAPKAP1 n=1 Tax=Henosepilachna vigintioctopunctata TaxID=420089 RepID=A0AAW1TRB2_9CUCU
MALYDNKYWLLSHIRNSFISSDDTVTNNEKSDPNNMFEKVDPKQRVKIVKKSLLSQKLEECTNLPKNPYMMYAKFDGTGQLNVPTRRYKILLTMLENDYKNDSLDVSCIASAKIIDLIGLILFNVRNRHANLTLHPPTHYGLYITEEDEVYRDLPPLDLKECVAKFGFTCLGLVEHKEPIVSFDESNKQTSDNDKPEASDKKKIGKEQSKTDESKITTDLEVMAVHKKAMEAPLYQSFQVNIITKMRYRVEVHLGISGEKIEIDPIQPKTSKFFLSKQKPVSCHMDSVAWCEIIDSKGSKTVFKVFYSSGYGNYKMENEVNNLSPLQASASFKHFDFEAEHNIAEEIVDKINLILDLRSSHSRKEYLAARERNLYKRKSFNISK